MRLAYEASFFRLSALTGHLLFYCLANASAGVHYVNLNSPNPTPPFSDWSTASADIQSAIQSNILGRAVTTSFTDANAIGIGPYFYRVGIQQ